MDKQQVEWLGTTVQEHYGRNFNRPAEENSYGIEIEMEGLGPDHEGFVIQDPAFPWRPVADGSLRDGIEFISNGPRSYTDLPNDLDLLAAYLLKKKFTPVFSYRTSVHVHMNATHMSMKDLVTLFVLYTVFETPMIDFGGAERAGNVHCLPVSHAQAIVDTLRALCYEEDTTDYEKRGIRTPWAGAARVVFNSERRYASFNFASVPNKGTIEFRSHRGTLDKQDILNWVNIIHSLKLAAIRLENPGRVITELSTLGVEAFAQQVFGERVPSFADFVTPYQPQIWEGIRLAQHIAFSRQTWPDTIVAKKKKDKPTGLYVDYEVEAIPAGRAGGLQAGELNINWAQFVNRPPAGMFNAAPPAEPAPALTPEAQAAWDRIQRRRREEEIFVAQRAQEQLAPAQRPRVGDTRRSPATGERQIYTANNRWRNI